MKKKAFIRSLLLFLFLGNITFAQNKEEREHRIKKAQFPSEGLQIIANHNNAFKLLKYYKEVDSVKKRYTAKFKKDRLFYKMDFDEKGNLIGLGFAIKPIDIPEENFHRITEYLSQTFEKSKVRKMFQTYLEPPTENIEKTIKNAFQNLILPDMVYELFVKGKKNGVRSDFEITFDATGELIHMRNALPANYDRVLY